MILNTSNIAKYSVGQRVCGMGQSGSLNGTITAVTGDQLAEEEGENGIFTKTLCYGIGERQAAMGNKPYATSNDLLEFVQIRVHEKTNNRMQPLGEKMLHDHFDAPCNGQVTAM